VALEGFIKQFGGITEEYKFYNGEVTIRYDVDAHVYLLETETGELEPQDGVTTVCHIIDKSAALVPWGCKMMAQKLLKDVPGSVVGFPPCHVIPVPDLEKWVLDAKGAHKEKLEEAGAIGHSAHDWIEQYIKLKIWQKELKSAEVMDTEAYALFTQAVKDHMGWKRAKLDERALNATKAALDWMQKHNVRWRFTERKIYSRKHKYAGTLDGLCEVDSCDNPRCCPHPFKDRLTVADWKTSNYLYLEYLLQTAAYEAAYEEETGEVVEDRWIIRLGKDDGEFETWHLESHNFVDDFGGFIDALDLVRRVRKIESRIQERKQSLRDAIKAEKQAAKKAKDESEALAKAEAKAKKKQEQEEALQLECKAFKNYKGSRKPTCNDGKGCKACNDLFASKHPIDLSYKALGYKRDVDGELIEPKNVASLMDVLGRKFRDEEPCKDKPASTNGATTSGIGTGKKLTSCVASDPWTPMVTCDGNHGAPRCYSPTCWQLDVYPWHHLTKGADSE